MLRRRAQPFDTPRKVRVWNWVFPGGIGTTLLSFVVFGLYRGEFNYRRRSEPITASENPLFFWIYLLLLFAVALLVLYFAFSDFQTWRRQRK